MPAKRKSLGSDPNKKGGKTLKFTSPVATCPTTTAICEWFLVGSCSGHAVFSNGRMNSLSEGCSDRPCLPRLEKEVIPLGSFEAFMDKTFDTEAQPPFNTPSCS